MHKSHDPAFEGRGSCLCGVANVPGRISRLDSTFSVTKLQLGAFQFEKRAICMYTYAIYALTKFVFGRICVTFVCSLFIVIMKTTKNIANWSNLLFKLKI